MMVVWSLNNITNVDLNKSSDLGSSQLRSPVHRNRRETLLFSSTQNLHPLNKCEDRDKEKIWHPTQTYTPEKENPTSPSHIWESNNFQKINDLKENLNNKSTEPYKKHVGLLCWNCTVAWVCMHERVSPNTERYKRQALKRCSQIDLHAQLLTADPAYSDLARRVLVCKAYSSAHPHPHGTKRRRAWAAVATHVCPLWKCTPTHSPRGRWRDSRTAGRARARERERKGTRALSLSASHTFTLVPPSHSSISALPPHFLHGYTGVCVKTHAHLASRAPQAGRPAGRPATSAL